MPSSAQLKKMAKLMTKESRAWYPESARLARAHTIATWGTTSGIDWGIGTGSGAITIIGTAATTSDWLIPSSSVTAGPSQYVLSTGSSVTFTGYTTGTSTIIPAPQASQDAWIRALHAEHRAADAAWRRMHEHHIEVRETAAQRRQRENEIAAARVRQEELYRQGRAEKRIADVRAKRLLIENITPAQRATLKTHGYFDVQVKGKTYRIKWGSHGNVYLVDRGREVRSFCIQPPDTPDGDTMLAQKLLLEADEESFLKIANARELM
jgi:hypothetical protein